MKWSNLLLYPKQFSSDTFFYMLKTEVSLHCKENKSVSPKGNQSWFIGRTDAEVEAPIPWPPDLKSWVLGMDPDAAKDWRQEEKEMTEDEMVGWHHWINGMSLSKLQEMVKDKEAWCAAVHGVVKSQTWLSNWTTINLKINWVWPQNYLILEFLKAKSLKLVNKKKKKKDSISINGLLYMMRKMEEKARKKKKMWKERQIRKVTTMSSRGLVREQKKAGDGRELEIPPLNTRFCFLTSYCHL